MSVESQPLTGSRLKTAIALIENVTDFVAGVGEDRVGFFTLTFPDDVTDPREAQKRWNSLWTNLLRDRWGRYIRVYERTSSGRIHYHVLVELPFNARTGFSWGSMQARRYSNVPPALRAEWKFLRENLGRFGFGRHELLPLKKTGLAVARYVAKYVAKSVLLADPRDKGVHLVEYSKRTRSWSSRFSFNTVRAKNWRNFVGALALAVGVSSISGLTERLGRDWPFHLRNYVANGGSLDPANQAKYVFINSLHKNVYDRAKDIRPSNSWLSQNHAQLAKEWEVCLLNVCRDQHTKLVGSTKKPLPVWEGADFEIGKSPTKYVWAKCPTTGRLLI